MVIEALGAIFSGGATGLVGSLISRWFDQKKLEQDVKLEQIRHKNEIEMRSIDLKLMQQEYESKNRLAITEGEMAADVEAAKAFQVSYQTEPKMYSNQSSFTSSQNWLMVVLDFVRGFIRPGITVYLVILTTIIFFTSEPEYKKAIVDVVLYLCTTCVLWWYGIRSKGKK